MTVDVELHAIKSPADEVFVIVSITATNNMPPAPLNLGLVIDNSASMGGGRLRAAKYACEAVIEKLGKDDVLSVVSFSERAKTHLERYPMTPANKARAIQAVHKITYGAGTNLSAGWIQGATCVASQRNSERYQNSVIIFSDGEANRGELDLATLAQHAEELRARGLYTSAIGIGNDYNWNYLRTLTEHGGGRMHDAETEEDIATVVLGELDDMVEAVANDIILKMDHKCGAWAQLLGTFPIRRTGLRDETIASIGSLPAHTTRNVIFRFRWGNDPAPRKFVVEAEVDWRSRGSERRSKSHQAVLPISFDSLPSARESAFTKAVCIAWQADIIRLLVETYRYGYDDLNTSAVRSEFTNFGAFAGEEYSYLLDQLKQYLEEIQNSDERSRKEFEISSYKTLRSDRDKRNRPPRFVAGDATGR